ncbi:AraC family transcriptional regulator [Paenibacillus physcomitrellae]|uniref:AraC family transcriptional regulator n=1 Tax=Paenibacillus physcomitrellae TaxID=1619311 RepID=A0ABQ1FWN4_9BACL|nr:AraC family transcriptional regulator [Paenibacillus physcomitrellae]GGA32718.1 AraC family transcriptional regulator [Paenibacillus physcomitrellae]
MNNKVIIQRVIDYIEDHLADELTLAELAEKAHYSEYHFHRMFQFFTGTTVMSYIRLRRLNRAAALIAETQRKVLDIALECGFRSHETFSRNFRKNFGIQPSEQRRKGITLPVTAGLQLLTCAGTGQQFDEWGDWKMDFKHVTLPATRIIGYRIETTVDHGQNSKDIPAFWQHYLANKLWENIPGKLNNVELGVCTESTPGGKFGYVIGYQVGPDTAVPDSLVEYFIPEQEYAVFTTPKAGPDEFVAAIQNTWNYVFTEWFPSSGFEHAMAPEIEWYDERCMTDGDKEMDIYVPIKPASKPQQEQ